MSWFASHKKPLLITLGIIGVVGVAITTWAILKAMEPKGSAAMQASNSQTSSQTTITTQLDSSTSSTIDSLQSSLKNNAADNTALDDALSDTSQQVTVPTE